MAMELPFAVDSSSDNDASSLVTASSQGSLVPADDDLLNLSSLQSGEPQQRQLLQSRGEEETGEDYDQTIVSSFSVLQQQQRANNYCATTYSTPIMNNVSAPTATPRAMTLPPTSQQHPSRLYPQQQHHHQQEVLPTASSSSRSSALYSPTIVDIPPTPQSQQQASSTSNSSFQPQHVAATSVTSTFGVDAALKSAGSRVTSVLSHFGYKTATAPPQQQQHRYPTSDASSNRGASPTTTSSIFSHFTSQSSAVASLPDSYPRGSSSLPSTLPAVHNRSDPSTLSMNGNPVGRTATTIQEHPDTEAIDFAYINVTDEDEVDVWLDENHHHHSRSTQQQQNGLYDSSETTGDDSRRRHVDILTILLEADRLNSPQDDSNNAAQLVSLSEQANAAAARAGAAKRQGRLQDALDRHSDAAKFFHEAARIAQDQDASVTIAFLLLSQSHAKSAIALKRVVKARPNALSSTSMFGSSSNNRLRAILRGALSSKPEADISDSIFLGKATKPPLGAHSPLASVDSDSIVSALPLGDVGENPVDEMMELERELRDMDMTLALGNSIASLDARTQNRMKNSVTESFMVVPVSGSYMSNSSSIILGPAAPVRSTIQSANSGGTAGMRARANRVQGLARTTAVPVAAAAPHTFLPATQNHPTTSTPSSHQQQPQSLESSWWGNASTSSQILSASVVSLTNTSSGQQQHNQPANTIQLMRLMDSLRTLGSENAALLREVDDAEAARIEARTAREQMKRFKEDYGKRFAALKEALEKFRKGYPGDNSTSGEPNPVTNSDFSRSASTSDQLQRQELLIRKLTADLKKEKEDGKKKDGALRKYESFYREVKARSAQKAAQRQRHHVPQAPRK